MKSQLTAELIAKITYDHLVMCKAGGFTPVAFIMNFRFFIGAMENTPGFKAPPLMWGETGQPLTTHYGEFRNIPIYHMEPDGVALFYKNNYSVQPN